MSCSLTMACSGARSYSASARMNSTMSAASCAVAGRTVTMRELSLRWKDLLYGVARAAEGAHGEHRIHPAGKRIAGSEEDLRGEAARQPHQPAEGAGAPSRAAEGLPRFLRQRGQVTGEAALRAGVHPRLHGQRMLLLHAAPLRFLEEAWPRSRRLARPREAARLQSLHRDR